MIENKIYYNSIFISDSHLGMKMNRPDLLNDFLKNHSCNNLFLVGDIIDFWQFKKRLNWKYDDSLVIRQILNKKRQGANVYYIIGNHDGILRPHIKELNIEGISLYNEISYKALNGKIYCITHGDLFDNNTIVWEIISKLGGKAYDFSIMINFFFNKIRTFFGLSPWSIALALKQNVKKISSYINSFEDHLVEYCNSKNYDGIICGHIHFPIIKNIQNLEYMNCGDWVESCSALVEKNDGKFEIIYWNNLHKTT